MRGYSQFSLWISIAVAKICFIPHSHKLRKKSSVLVGTLLKSLQPSAWVMERRKTGMPSPQGCSYVSVGRLGKRN